MPSIVEQRPQIMVREVPVRVPWVLPPFFPPFLPPVRVAALPLLVILVFPHVARPRLLIISMRRSRSPLLFHTALVSLSPMPVFPRMSRLTTRGISVLSLLCVVPFVFAAPPGLLSLVVMIVPTIIICLIQIVVLSGVFWLVLVFVAGFVLRVVLKIVLILSIVGVWPQVIPILLVIVLVVVFFGGSLVSQCISSPSVRFLSVEHYERIVSILLWGVVLQIFTVPEVVLAFILSFEPCFVVALVLCVEVVVVILLFIGRCFPLAIVLSFKLGF